MRCVIIVGATLLVTGCAGSNTKSVVLFDGASWDAWSTREGAPSAWVIHPDGSVEAAGADAVSRRDFGDFELHLEFLCPVMEHAEGQARANSGVYLHGRYEVQVLDSYGLAPALNGCGAVYSIAMPSENASLPPGQWQTYDITFRAPRFGYGGVTRPRVTVVHNGIVIHDDLELPATSPGGIDREMVPVGPILLQFHGDPVRYRDIRVRVPGGEEGAQGRRGAGAQGRMGGSAFLTLRPCAPAPLRPFPRCTS